MNLVNEPDWIGAFTRDQAEGAIPNGTAIQKINSERNDKNPDGTLGTVLGSVDSRMVNPPPGIRRSDYVYWVEWKEQPKVAVFIMGFKIARLA